MLLSTGFSNASETDFFDEIQALHSSVYEDCAIDSEPLSKARIPSDLLHVNLDDRGGIVAVPRKQEFLRYLFDSHYASLFAEARTDILNNSNGGSSSSLLDKSLRQIGIKSEKGRELFKSRTVRAGWKLAISEFMNLISAKRARPHRSYQTRDFLMPANSAGARVLRRLRNRDRESGFSFQIGNEPSIFFTFHTDKVARESREARENKINAELDTKARVYATNKLLVQVADNEIHFLPVVDREGNASSTACEVDYIRYSALRIFRQDCVRISSFPADRLNLSVQTRHIEIEGLENPRAQLILAAIRKPIPILELRREDTVEDYQYYRCHYSP